MDKELAQAGLQTAKAAAEQMERQPFRLNENEVGLACNRKAAEIWHEVEQAYQAVLDAHERVQVAAEALVAARAAYQQTEGEVLRLGDVARELHERAGRVQEGLAALRS